MHRQPGNLRPRHMAARTPARLGTDARSLARPDRVRSSRVALTIRRTRQGCGHPGARSWDRKRFPMGDWLSRSCAAERRGDTGLRALHRPQPCPRGFGRELQGISLLGCDLALARGIPGLREHACAAWRPAAKQEHRGQGRSHKHHSQAASRSRHSQERGADTGASLLANGFDSSRKAIAAEATPTKAAPARPQLLSTNPCGTPASRPRRPRAPHHRCRKPRTGSAAPAGSRVAAGSRA
jgi:hypothetical protein